MTECTNETMRDLLPLLARELRAGDEAARVRAHVADCASCAAELRLLERASALFAAATPAVNTAAILAKLPASPAQRPPLHVVTPVRTRPVMPRRALALAASLLLMVTVSSPVWGPRVFGGPGVVSVVPGVDTGPDVPTVITTPGAGSRSGVQVVGGRQLEDLGEDELSSLLGALDELEANLDAEPVTLTSPIITTSEGM